MKVPPKDIWILLGLATTGLVLSPDLSWAGDEPRKTAPNAVVTLKPAAAPQPDSATNVLDLDDMQKFRPGRPKDEILKEVHWVGNLEMATEDRGKTLAAISFEVRPKEFGIQFFDTVWAIFVDGKFTKFVRNPEVSYPIPVGSFETLRRAAALKPIVLKDYKQEQEEERKKGMRRQPNPFLTAYVEAHRGEFEAYSQPRRERNARLRDRFNAARLRLGMTKAEVALALKAKPLDSGDLEAGTFEVYGATEYVGWIVPLQYHNILVLYRGDRLTGIYSGDSAPGGVEGFDTLRKPVDRLQQRFTGLPPAVNKNH